MPFCRQPKHHRKRQHTERAKRGSRRVERCRLSASPFAWETCFLLTADLVLFDETGTGAEYGGQSQKEPADPGAILAADEACKHGRGTAKNETDQVFVPATFLER